MKFLENVKTVYTSEPYYDLFDGGYIDPYKLLEEKDADKISEAIDLITDFLYEAEKRGLIEYT